MDLTAAEVAAFNILQKLFTKPEILTYFNPSRRLFIDINGSQERGFRAYTYHVKDNSESKQPK